MKRDNVEIIVPIIGAFVIIGLIYVIDTCIEPNKVEEKLNKNMITEDYVSFETAKLLKEKGFNEEVLTYYIYDTESKFYEFRLDDRWDNPNNFPGDCISAPTIQMAMKWLREKYNLEIYPYHNNPTIYNSKWWFEVIEYPNSIAEYESGKDEEFDTYEQVCDTAIKYCLENLI